MAMTPKAVLVVQDGRQAGQRVEVVESLVIGRQGADYDIEDDEVSHRHACARFVGNDVVLEDCGSTNGTWVNGVRIEAPTVLRSGDIVRVGRTSIGVEFASPGTVVAEPQAGAGSAGRPPADPDFAPLSGYKRRGIATRDIRIEILTIAAIVTTAAALVVYFALR